MSSNIISLKTYRQERESDIDDMNHQQEGTQYSVFLDTRVIPLKTDGRFDILFNRKIFILSIFIRELIVKITEENQGFFLDTRFLVIRFKELSTINNNFVYNTSFINPDTDIIVNKTVFDERYLTFESKYIFNLYMRTKSFKSLQLQILDDKGAHLPQDNDLFVDIKFITYDAL